MRIREVVEENYNALPGYKLVGYSEIAIPIFQRRLKVLVFCSKSIPVVEQFVLNFYNEGINLDDIRKILGITEQLINEAWVGLIQRDYINNITNKITDLGKDYLKYNKVEKLEKNEIQISIDGLTGKISRLNKQFMLSKTMKEKGVKAIKSVIRKLEIDDIDFNSTKRVYKEYKNFDMENYKGDLIDIIDIYGNTTRYRKIDVLLFQNNEKELRILAYDGYDKIDEYEEKLLEKEYYGYPILDYNIDNYLSDSIVKKFNSIIESSNYNECERIELDIINSKFKNYLDKNNSEIIIVIPLISVCKIDTTFIEDIRLLIESKVKVNIILAGEYFSSDFQKNICLNLKRLKRYSNFTLNQVPCYINKMVLDLNKLSALVSIYNENNIISNGSKKGIIETTFEVKGNSFENIYSKLIKTIKKYEAPIQKSLFTESNILENKIKKIITLARDCDGYMNSNDGIGWFDKLGIPEIENLIKIPLAKNSEEFKIFIDRLNKSLVESLEYNAKIKKRRNYFWNDFQKIYPELFNILNKIKTYRNKSSHLKLNDINGEKYIKYVKEDLNGFDPDFIKDGYIIIQEKILTDLENSIRDTLNKISK